MANLASAPAPHHDWGRHVCSVSCLACTCRVELDAENKLYPHKALDGCVTIAIHGPQHLLAAAERQVRAFVDSIAEELVYIPGVSQSGSKFTCMQ